MKMKWLGFSTTSTRNKPRRKRNWPTKELNNPLTLIPNCSYPASPLSVSVPFGTSCGALLVDDAVCVIGDDFGADRAYSF